MTVSEIISIAKVSQYLAANDISRRGIYGGGVDNLLPRKLYNIRRDVEWLYELDPDDQTLIGTANYLYALCAPYNGKAALLINNSIGGIIINPITGVPANITPIRLQFVIGESGSLMNAGDTTLVLNYANVISGTLLVFLDGVELPTNRSDRISYSVYYTIANVTITFNQPVQNNQLFVIRFLQGVMFSSATNGGSGGGGIYIGDL